MRKWRSTNRTNIALGRQMGDVFAPGQWPVAHCWPGGSKGPHRAHGLVKKKYDRSRAAVGAVSDVSWAVSRANCFFWLGDYFLQGYNPQEHPLISCMTLIYLTWHRMTLVSASKVITWGENKVIWPNLCCWCASWSHIWCHVDVLWLHIWFWCASQSSYVM